MDKIFNLLENHRLEKFYKAFLDFGVRDERDFLDGITDEDLNSIGKSGEIRTCPGQITYG